MTQAQHLAEFNIGTLKYDWNDPRVKDFADGLDRVNAIAMRSPGFVWMLNEAAMDAAQRDPDGPLGGNPRTAATLSVWEDAGSLEDFFWNTVHKQFYDRKAEWYGPTDKPRMVLWWVPAGHRPSIAEAMARYDRLAEHGDTADAFGWSRLQEAQLRRSRNCDRAAG